MSKQNNTGSPENDPVLLPPDGGGKGGRGGSQGNGRIVLVGLALLIVLAFLVVWVLPDLGEKPPNEETVKPLSQQEDVLPVVEKSVTSVQQIETIPDVGVASADEQKDVQQAPVGAEVIVQEQLESDNQEDDEDVDEHIFQQAVGRTMAALTEGKFKDARFALQEAKAIRPDDPILIDLAGQISSKELSFKLSRLREKSLISEGQEKWQQAVDVCRQALSLSSTAAFATTCLDRAQGRLDLDKRLQTILARPERLFDKGPLQGAKDIHTLATSISSPGPRLLRQIKELSALIDQADSEVSVVLRSDTFTDIVIYHVGRLGRFAEKKMVLRSGNYTVVGSRQGFRDVRQVIKVRPGSRLVFTVRCEEEI